MRGLLAVAVALVALLVAVPATAAREASAERAPDITGTTLNGKKLSLAWYRTRTVFLNLWASW